jgi:predicted DNA-binding protein
MEVHFSPDIQARLDQLASDTGRSTDEFVRDAMAGYFDELARTREMLDNRYDELKSGKVKPIPANEVEAHFAAKSAAHRSRRT